MIPTVGEQNGIEESKRAHCRTWQWTTLLSDARLRLSGCRRCGTLPVMVAQNLLDAVFALPVDEQVDLMEQLRRRLTPAAADPLDDAGAFALTDEHRRVLAERIEEHRRDPTDGLPWDEVKAQLPAKLGTR